jgi:hypothetical protein
LSTKVLGVRTALPGFRIETCGTPAKYSAEHMPNARLLSYATGGHILIGHADAFEEIAKFLAQNAGAQTEERAGLAAPER